MKFCDSKKKKSSNILIGKQCSKVLVCALGLSRQSGLWPVMSAHTSAALSSCAGSSAGPN